MCVRVCVCVCACVHVCVRVCVCVCVPLCRFESEAEKWDAENDIVVLAKEMCTMMMDMSDFTL